MCLAWNSSRETTATQFFMPRDTEKIYQVKLRENHPLVTPLTSIVEVLFESRECLLHLEMMVLMTKTKNTMYYPW